MIHPNSRLIKEVVMTYVIAQPCVGHKDLLCLGVCPTGAIAGQPSDPQMYINPDLCIQCGLCIEVCPTQAIYPAEDLPEYWSGYLQLNRSYFAHPKAN